MNKLDDFLKNKLNDAAFDTPSGWEALSEAIPAKNTGKLIAGWAFALLLIGGLTTSVVVFKNTSSKSTPISNIYTAETNKGIGEPTPVTEKVIASAENTKVSNPVSNSKGVVSTVVHPLTNPANPTSPTYDNEAKAVTDVPNTAVTPKGETGKNSPDVIPAKEKSVSAENKKEVNPTNVASKESNPVQKLSPTKTEKVTVRKKSENLNEFQKGKLYVVASVSLIGSFRSFQLNDGAAPYIHKQYDNIRQNSEQPIITNGVSLGLEYRILKNFSIQGGLSYNKIGFLSDYNFEVTDKAKIDNTGRVIGYETLPVPIDIATKGRTTIGVLRIPFGINYNLLFKSNALFHIYIGGAQNFLLSAGGTALDQLTLQQKSISKTDFVNTAREMCVDLGINFALSSRYGLGVDLYYNKWMTDISKNKYENVTPFSGGLNFSISRKLF